MSPLFAASVHRDSAARISFSAARLSAAVSACANPATANTERPNRAWMNFMVGAPQVDRGEVSSKTYTHFRERAPKGTLSKVTQKDEVSQRRFTHSSNALAGC